MAFVVSDGALLSISRAAPPPIYAMRIGDSLSADYATLWRVQPELRTVVDFISRNIAQLGIHVFRRLSDVDRERLTDHPLARILNSPNPSTTRFRLVSALVHDLCIFDNGFWLKVRVDKSTVGLRRVRPQRIFPTGADWLEPDGYDIVGTKGVLSVPADAVVHFRGYNPNDDRLGTPPVEALRQILAEEWEANIYRQQLWRNGTRANGYITRPKDAPDWGPKGRERFRAEWDSQYTGNAGTAGATPLLEDGMTFVPSSTTPRDAQYIESRKLTREEVARTYHVPLPMVGILDHATFSNIREQHKNLYQDCLGPWVEMLAEEIELQLLPDLPDSKDVYVEFNIAEKLRGSFEEEALQLQTAVGGPWMTRNEARGRVNLPYIDGGDDLIVPLNVSTGPTGDPEPLPDDDDSDEKRRHATLKAQVPQAALDSAAAQLGRFFARQGQVIASTYGAVKAKGKRPAVADIFDELRWDAELTADIMRVTTHLNPSVAPEQRVTSAASTAKSINTQTLAELTLALQDSKPLDAIGRMFLTYATQRAADIAAASI